MFTINENKLLNIQGAGECTSYHVTFFSFPTSKEWNTASISPSLGASKAVPWVQEPAAQVWWLGSNPWSPYVGGRRWMTPQSYLLTSTHAIMCTHTKIIIAKTRFFTTYFLNTCREYSSWKSCGTQAHGTQSFQRINSSAFHLRLQKGVYYLGI